MSRVFPDTLVMRQLVCSYCGRDHGIREARVEWLFGIYFCPDHEDDAQRDLRLYFEDQHMVRVGDALLDGGDLGEFLRFCQGRDLPVRRTGGAFDAGGWMLHTGAPQLDCSYLLRQQGTAEWMMPLIRTDGSISKNVKLQQWMADDSVRSAVLDSANTSLQAQWDGWLRTVPQRLDAGFYRTNVGGDKGS